MPFGFGRKKTDDTPNSAAGVPAVDSGAPRQVRFQAFTDEWRLDGQIDLSGRLLDLLNRREAIPVMDVRWGSLDANTELEPAPGIGSMDPYDLIIVLAGADTLAARTDEERAAHRIHKVTYDVALEAPPFRVVGSVQVPPGAVPEVLLDRGTQMFAAITDAVVAVGDATLDVGDVETVLVNRFYLRNVTQVDGSTGLPHMVLPDFSGAGSPAGSGSGRLLPTEQPAEE